MIFRYRVVLVISISSTDFSILDLSCQILSRGLTDLNLLKFQILD